MPEDTTPDPRRQPRRRIDQLNALIAELEGMFDKTKGSPLESRRSVLAAHAYAIRDTLADLEKLAKL